MPVRRRAAIAPDCRALGDGGEIELSQLRNGVTQCLAIDDSAIEFVARCRVPVGTGRMHRMGRDLLEVAPDGLWVTDVDRVR